MEQIRSRVCYCGLYTPILVGSVLERRRLVSPLRLRRCCWNPVVACVSGYPYADNRLNASRQNTHCGFLHSSSGVSFYPTNVYRAVAFATHRAHYISSRNGRYKFSMFATPCGGTTHLLRHFSVLLSLVISFIYHGRTRYRRVSPPWAITPPILHFDSTTFCTVSFTLVHNFTFGDTRRWARFIYCCYCLR